jgi:hypothetical protein
LHIVQLAIGLATSQSADSDIRLYKDVTRRIGLFQTTIPVSATIKKTVFAPQKSETLTDLLPYDARFIDAQWCPLEIGLYESPLFAVMTTKRTLHVFESRINHLKGPYTILSCVNEDVDDGAFKLPIASFTWFQPTSAEEGQKYAFLVGATLSGTTLVWKIAYTHAGPQVSEHASIPLNVGSAYRLACSKDRDGTGKRFLSLASRQGNLQIFGFQMDDDSNLTFERANFERTAPQGAFITHMSWHAGQLAFTTPGAAHLVTVSTGRGLSILLGDSDGDDASLYLQPPAGVRWCGGDCYELFLQDGSVYDLDFRTMARSKGDSNTVAPRCTIEVPVELIADVQRKVERLRGLYSYSEDGSGLALLCYDANEIADWSYLLNTRCSLEFAFTKLGKAEDSNIARATHILRVLLHRSELQTSRLLAYRRHLAFIHLDCEDGEEIVELCLSELQEIPEGEYRKDVRGALLLLSWLKTLEGLSTTHQEQVMSLFSDLQKASVQLCIASSTYEPAFAMRSSNIARYAFIERQILILAASALVVDGFKGGRNAAHMRLAVTAKGADHGAKLVKEWMRLLREGKQLDLGERCAACDAPVTLNADDILRATCKNGHPWRRCSTTRSLLIDAQALECIACGAQAMMVQQATNELQSAMLERAKRCTICHASFIQV